MMDPSLNETAVQRTQCTRCYHLSCPVNRVPEEVKVVFYQNYPDFAPKEGKVVK